MDGEKTKLHGATSDTNEAQSNGVINNSESNAGPPGEPRPARGDRGKIHRRRNGFLTKHPLEALARRGENMREIGRQERALRSVLQPSGPLGKILFDRMWSSYLRCLLIDRVEAELLGTDQQGATTSELPKLLVDKMPTLVYGSVEDRAGVGAEILKYLAVTQRYDSHFFGEFYRTLGLLLALKGGGFSGLTDALLKTSS